MVKKMRLRYYLRGLGIGMLMVALILTAAGRTGGKMSDEEVKRRAAELGMVEKDKTVLDKLGSDAAQVQSESAEKEPSAQTDIEAQAALPENTAKKEEPVTSGNTSKKEEAAKPESAPQSGTESVEQKPGQGSAEQKNEQNLANQIEQRANEAAERGKEVAENAPAGKVVTFVVERGDSSTSVARRAKDMGLVVSAADFDAFLCQNGYDRRICTGSYEIVEGASAKEIADKITKSN